MSVVGVDSLAELLPEDRPTERWKNAARGENVSRANCASADPADPRDTALGKGAAVARGQGA